MFFNLWKTRNGTLGTRIRVFFKNTSGRLLWKWSVFFKFFWQFFTSILKIFETFRERFIFQITGLFFLFMFGFYTMKPRHVDESSNRTKQRLYWKSIHASVSITKIGNFLLSFSKVFVLVGVRTNGSKNQSKSC